jgi:hypothetical protein
MSIGENYAGFRYGGDVIAGQVVSEKPFGINDV